jgi:ankyrin repeat protein
MSKESKSEQKAGQAAPARPSVAAASLALWFACGSGIVSSNRATGPMSVQAAIAAGADVNYSHEGWSCLSVAAANGHNEVVSLLIIAGVDKEAKDDGGLTALMGAAQYGQGKCVELLLTAGADKEAKTQEGFTALCMAAQEGNDKCAELLLTAGVDKEAKTYLGATALFMAAQEGHDKCLELLLTAGADKEAKMNDDTTALYMAAQNGHDKCVELLLDARCDVNALNDVGASALFTAVNNKRIDCVRILVRCGANVTLQFRGILLNDVADSTTMADALKATLRLPAEKRRRCEQCDKTTFAKLQKCSACRKVYYCNRECQLVHWLQHKPVCNVVAE